MAKVTLSRPHFSSFDTPLLTPSTSIRNPRMRSTGTPVIGIQTFSQAGTVCHGAVRGLTVGFTPFKTLAAVGTSGLNFTP
ncbi:hypothetical protein D3C74_239280 [compost metagenome]